MEQPQQPRISEHKISIEQQAEYLSPEFLQRREVCWVPINNRLVYIGCGDDRGPTSASAEELMEGKGEAVMNPLEGYASIYGATAGLAKNTLVVGVAQFGTDFIDAVGGFDDVMELLVLNSHNLQTLHSAERNEQDQRHFSFAGAAPIGCAYAAGIGATADLLVGSSSMMRDVARSDQHYTFGSDAGFDDLLRGEQAFLNHATNHQGANFTVGRDSYKRYKEHFGEGLGIMILRGSHTGAKTSGVISNFSLTQVGSPVKAHERQLDFYRLDIAVATDTVLQALSKPLADLNKKYVLSPELLMRAFQLDAVPVRAVLGSHDQDPDLSGKLDPLSLKIGFRGNPFDSRNILVVRQESGYYTRAA